MEKMCVSCGERVTGRADKKYCNEACKNEFHNRKSNRQSPAEKARMTAARKNRSILSKIEASGLTQIGKTELELCGFNFEALTGLKMLGKGKFLLYCFDYQLQLQKEEWRIERI
ncbi:MAG: hypothetical protein M3Q95_08710 [Bacteroidota bacterium]|nr:hypothetical protein [Bacteroidota bacterium]